MTSPEMAPGVVLCRFWRRCLLVCCLAFGPLLTDGAAAARNVCALPGLTSIQDGLGGTGHTGGDGGEGLGGTGMMPGDGIGGTGRPLASLPDGLGGTGHRSDGLGGTGSPRERLHIRGVVTGFGSICVAGLEVRYSPATPVRIDGMAATSGALAVGQVVDIEARLRGGSIHAEQVRVLRQLVGKVEEVDVLAGRVRIAGTLVDVPERVAGLRIPDLRPGQPVMVSGLWRTDGALHATRIEAAPRHDIVSESPRPLRNGLAVLQGVVAQVRDGQIQLVDGPSIRLSGDVSVPSRGALATVLVEVDGPDVVSRALAVTDIDDLHQLTGRPEPVVPAPSDQPSQVGDDERASLSRAPYNAAGMQLDAESAPHEREIADEPDATETPELPEWQDTPDAPDWPQVPEPPDEPEVPDLPEQPEVPDLPTPPDEAD